YRANLGGHEQESVGVPPAHPDQAPGELSRNNDSGQVVVGERRVTYMRGYQHLIGRLTWQTALPVREIAVAQSGVDTHLILTVRHRLQLSMTQREGPVLPEVGSPEGNKIWLIRKRIQVRFQLS